MLLVAAGAVAKSAEKSDWLSNHATLIVGLVGIVFSGFVGPTVTALFLGKRERAKDARGLAAAEGRDLRDLLDEAARVLGGAVTRLRPLLEAERTGHDLPPEPVEFLGSLVPLGQRLQLRLSAGHVLLSGFDDAVDALSDLSKATDSQAAWDAGVDHFEKRRSEFLAAGREAVDAQMTQAKGS